MTAYFTACTWCGQDGIIRVEYSRAPLVACEAHQQTLRLAAMADHKTVEQLGGAA